ncbi:MAG: c-type cytochrome [Acidobacteriota bacterium]
MRRVAGTFFLASVASFAAEPCQKCHKLDARAHPLAAPAAHAAARLGCASCHGSPAAGKDPHAGLLPRAAIESTCGTCHGTSAPGDFKAALAGPFARRTGSPRVLDGAILYERMACAGCHGGAGDAGIPQAQAFGRALEPGGLAWWTRGGDRVRAVSRCPSGALAATALEEVERRWDAGDGRAEGSAVASAEEGEVLVAKARCVTCHAIAGRGGRRAMDLALAGTVLRETALRTWNDLAPACPDFRFKAPERSAIAAYVASLARGEGRGAGDAAAVDVERCVRCHGPDRPPPVPLPHLSFDAARAALGSHADLTLADGDRDRLAAYVSSRPKPEIAADDARAALAKAAPGIACLDCHRRDEQGGDLAPDLGIAARRLRKPWLIAFLLEPSVVRPGIGERMPRFGLSRAEADGIAGVLGTWSSPAATPPALGDPARGAILYHERGCASCHAFRGRGAAIAPPLDLAAERLDPAFVVDMIEAPGKLVPEAAMPATRDHRDALDIAAYVLEPPSRD